MLDRHTAGAEDGLETGRIAEDEDDDEGKEDGGKEVEVLGRFVERGGVLEDAEMAGPGRHEVEPLPGEEYVRTPVKWVMGGGEGLHDH